eukprot:gb/GFBE01058096.1/.p1 GENE.gb/GFBE01058096.1/~~gb/GFBE01058096.1/.p1  ORF type:complete len:588 (+),score=148.10 gb/GFBE01058096.1/:1-1764(+)
MPLPSSVENSLSKLKDNVKAWAEMPDLERAAVARACRKQFATLDLDWVQENMKCIGLDPSRRDSYNSISTDPFIFTAATVDRLDKAADALEGKLKELSKEPQRTSPEGMAIYPMGKVGPSASGVEFELWAKPSDAGSPAAPAAVPGGVSLVLGAGNQNFLTTVDVIERAFVHKECVFLKNHPIRPFMKPVFEHIFAPLAEKGAFAMCLDSELEGAYEALTCHEKLSHIHMTGSGATHNQIVASLKKSGRTKKVAFTSELGCVSPWIICPGTKNDGTWAEGDIKHHAAMLTAAFKSSCSMNCLSPKVLVLPTEKLWPQRPAFLAALKEKLASAPDLPPYYPGAHKRYSDFEKEYKDCEKIQAPPAQDGEPRPAPYKGQDFKQLPSMLVDVGTLGAPDCRSYALLNEAFSPVLAIATVDCGDAKDFPVAAAKAVNKNVFGNLSCALIYPDDRDEALDKALAELSYGSVGVNVWPALGYSNSLAAWGASPGAYTPENPQSGLDFVGNMAQVPNLVKTVLLSPFVNSSVSLEKPIPMLIADALQVLVSGKSFAVPRILGMAIGRGFGLFSRRMPAAEGERRGSRATMCFGS